MPIFAVAKDGGVPALGALPPIPQESGAETLDSELRAPVTFVSKRRDWLGDLAQTIRDAFRRSMVPAAAALLAGTLLVSGCATKGVSLQSPVDAMHASQHQQRSVDLDRTKQIIEARGDASQLAKLLQGLPHSGSIEWLVTHTKHPAEVARLLEEKMADPKARAELGSLDEIYRVLRYLDMEAATKNFSTPGIGVFIDDRVAQQTESGGEWHEDKNRAWTVNELGPNGSIDLLLFCVVSGHVDHAEDAAFYPKYTGYQTPPSGQRELMRANAQIYSQINSHYIYLTDDPTSYSMGKIVVADVKANGRHVTPVRVHLEGLEAGKTYEVRWSPYVGADPSNPTVHYTGFKNGRTFRLKIPANVALR